MRGRLLAAPLWSIAFKLLDISRVVRDAEPATVILESRLLENLVI